MSAVSSSPHARLPVILLAALLINLLLFTAIEFMVGAKRVRLTQTEDFNIANFIRMQEDSREVRSRREPTAPQKPQAEVQKDIQRLTSASSGPGDMTFELPEYDVDVGLDLGGDIAIARELTPLVRVPPVYPPRATRDEVEGYVTLRFVVTETGSVENPEVLRSEPPGVFDRAAMRAVMRWKFQPHIRNGKAVRVYAINTINFELLEES